MRTCSHAHYKYQLGFTNVGLIFEERGKPSTRRKTSRSKDENQHQTQPTYDTETGSRTWATLVGGERSHHCAIPALPFHVSMLYLRPYPSSLS